MSTEKLEAYKAAYSKYIDYAVNVHNYHLIFINNVGLDSGKQIRNSLREMVKLEKELTKLCNEAYHENRENKKEQRARLRELRKKAKPRVMPTYKGKNKHNVMDAPGDDSK